MVADMLFWNLFGNVAKIKPEISQHILKTIYYLLLLKRIIRWWNREPTEHRTTPILPRTQFTALILDHKFSFVISRYSPLFHVILSIPLHQWRNYELSKVIQYMSSQRAFRLRQSNWKLLFLDLRMPFLKETWFGTLTFYLAI